MLVILIMQIIRRALKEYVYIARLSAMAKFLGFVCHRNLNNPSRILAYKRHGASLDSYVSCVSQVLGTDLTTWSLVGNEAFAAS